jgi:4,5-dihydroxyphthalate decarboxylase
MPLTLRAVSRTQGNNAALKDGSIQPVGVELSFIEEPVLVRAFRAMVRELTYDICEMAITTYLCAREHGVRFTALPVFLVRGFHHGALQVMRDGPVRAVTDLEGTEVGVNRGYTVTTGVWGRGLLAVEHGLDLDAVTWRPSGDEHVVTYHPPGNDRPLWGDQPLLDPLLDGDLAAVVGADLDHPDVVPLLPEPDAAALRALRDRGTWPINHLVVVRDDVLAERPWVAQSLYDAFTASKDQYIESLAAGTLVAPTATDALHRLVMSETGSDPLPYGLDANRNVLEQLIDMALAQHILSERPALEALFADVT